MSRAEKTAYICMNHEPSHHFSTRKDPPNCPICKTDEWVCSYSGGRYTAGATPEEIQERE